MTPQYGLHVQEGGFAQATAVGNEMLFAVAPSLFLGDRRSSYAHLFGFSFRVGTTDGMKFQFGDITLEGANGLKVSTTLTGILGNEVGYSSPLLSPMCNVKC